MTKPTPSTTLLVQNCLDRLRAGDAAARDELIAVAAGRLRRLTHKMLTDFDRLKRWEDVEDVAQGAALRLYQALRDTVPETSLGFFRLGALQIRRELIDLARHYFGPRGTGANHASAAPGTDSVAPGDPSQSTYDPGRLAEWTEFHSHVERLPEEDRTLIDLLWYQGLPQEEVAGLLGVDVRTVQRRWVRVRLLLHGALRGEPN
jgi:RNA polymerase sigma-70 factor (ECF subfamily)